MSEFTRATVICQDPSDGSGDVIIDLPSDILEGMTCHQVDGLTAKLRRKHRIFNSRAALRQRLSSWLESRTLLEEQLSYHVFNYAGGFMETIFRRMCFVSVMPQVITIVSKVVVSYLYGLWLAAAK